MTPSPGSGNTPGASTLEDRYLTLDELAHYAGLSRRTLERYLRDPVHPIKAYRVGKAVRVRKSDYDHWIADRQAPATTAGADLSDDDRRIAMELRGYRQGRH